ncbi:MAG: multicopper oxidase domain-containing protein, partial [Gemmatimonadaceae bacterium]
MSSNHSGLLPAADEPSLERDSSRVVDRRRFLVQSALATVAAGALSACERTQAQPSPVAKTATHLAAAPDPATLAARAKAKADEMDRMHEASIKAFPAKTAGKGSQPLAPKMDGRTKVFELTATEMQWEITPGQRVAAMAYNQQVPGPEIRVREGDRVRIVLKNELSESTAMHFHGLEVPNDVDGVPFITQPPLKPGESFTYDFTVPNSGSHMYHSHHNSTKQVGLGLLGAFIVEPKVARPIERVDRDFVFILNDGVHGYTFNGKGFPATEPLVAKLGE